MKISDEINQYRQKTLKSLEWFKRSKAVLPGGICHEVRSYAPYPFLIESSYGPFINDLDGNRYIDYWMGHYINLLGHNPTIISEAITSQIKKGIMWGMLHEKEVELAELIVELVPSAEAVRFCSTGTEATMYAVRLARGVTGKSLVLKMAGGWHGSSTDLFHSVTKNFERSESLGITTEGSNQFIQSLPFNDIDSCKVILQRPEMENLAAIIVEPMAGSSWFIPAKKSFLKFLRQECDRLGAVLIFDEIITGFRFTIGGAQEYYGVVPDLTTLGKVMSGGLPGAAVVGKKRIMEYCNPITGLPKWSRVRIGGGTFSCHPLSMATGLALLNHLKSDKQIYIELNKKGNNFREELTSIFTARGISVAVTGIGSLFTIHFPKEGFSEPTNPSEALENCYYSFKEKILKIILLNRGIYAMHGGGAISKMHMASEIDRTLLAFEEIAEAIHRGNLSLEAKDFPKYD